MCQQVQTVTLQTAVLQQVSEFAANNTVFSVHDITVAIRQKTSSGELEIPEVKVQGSSFRFDIPHSKVKALFDELYRTGVFDPNYRLDRVFNGTYFEYTPTALASAVSVPTPSHAPTPAYVAPVTPAPVSVTTTTTTDKSISQTNANRIHQYLTNCIAKNFRPTLRKVQSAIKRNDAIPIPSCEELKQYIASIGYSIVDDPDSVSRAQVVTN